MMYDPVPDNVTDATRADHSSCIAWRVLQPAYRVTEPVMSRVIPVVVNNDNANEPMTA